MSDTLQPRDSSLPGSSVHWILWARILKWVAIPSLRGSSWPRDWTRVSCITDLFFTIWGSREAPGMVFSSVQFSSVESLSHIRLSATPWTTAHQASLSITNFQSLFKLMSTKSDGWCHLIFCCPLLLLPFPASESSPMSQFFTSGCHSTRVSASASVLPFNIQYWFPLELTCSPRDSQESSPTPQFKSTNSLVLRFLFCQTLTSVHTWMLEKT